MQLFVYILAYPILWAISKLPWKLFYLFSDLVFLFVFYVIQYRRKVVAQNLKLVFPEKSDQEIRHIRKAFYKHMCDMFLEMIKPLSISEADMRERLKFTNLEVLKEMEAKGKSIIGVFGHYANYEWSNSVQLYSPFICAGIYKRIENKYFDKLLRKIRSRFDNPLIESHQVSRQILRDKSQGKLCMYAMISDQSPRVKSAMYWTQFMGIRVPVITGSEALAKKLDLSVFYFKVTKKKRGFYEAEIVPITTDAKNCEDYYITNTYLRLLEEQIKEQPAFYLWTHKRWKHRNAEIPKGAIVN